jgi:hypothetical protein
VTEGAFCTALRLTTGVAALKEAGSEADSRVSDRVTSSLGDRQTDRRIEKAVVRKGLGVEG